MNQELFKEELKQLEINVNNIQLKQLEQYYNLLIEWNEKINLTRIVEKEEVYLKHFYDSLTLIKIIDLGKPLSLCDLGSGAGFPGIVLKIIFPNLKITLVDSLNKRINFLDLVISKLNLNNIETIHSRIEEYAKTNREKYDIVTARAVANLNTLLEISLPLTKVGGYFIAMKGNISQEIISIDNSLNLLNSKIENIIEFRLPIEDSIRTLVKIKKLKTTSDKYPRRYDLIKNRPL